MKFVAMGSVIALGALTLCANGASAAVVCNDEGDCWHVHGKPHYKPEFGLHIHPDSWKWDSGKYRWHEHEGHGYWKGGVWIGL